VLERKNDNDQKGEYNDKDKSSKGNSIKNMMTPKSKKQKEQENQLKVINQKQAESHDGLE
jgi:hypothetical protein